MRWNPLIILLISSCFVSAQQVPVISKIGFGSCIQESKEASTWKGVFAAEPQIFVLLGDNVYGDTDDMDVLKRKYERLGAQKSFQKLKKSAEVFAIWDDHDYGQNDAGAEYKHRKGSEKVFLDFFEEPADSMRRKREGIYMAKMFGPPGKRVHLILLDTRYFRSSLDRMSKSTVARYKLASKYRGPYEASKDTTKTLLGEAQWDWLEEELKKPADLKILASSIQVVHEDHFFERWMNFPHERKKLVNLLGETGVNNLIVLSGDRHCADISQMQEIASNGVSVRITDITSSGISKSGGGYKEPNRHRVTGSNYRMKNFGLLEIDWVMRRVNAQIRNAESGVELEHTIGF